MRSWKFVPALALLASALTFSADANAAKRGKLTGVVNLNQASAAQLDLLPGVGEKAAKRIIEHRAKTPFTRVEELVKVRGFGKKKFEKLKPHLAVSGATTAKLEGSSEGKEALSAIPAALKKR